MQLLGTQVVVLAEKPFAPVACGGVGWGLGWQQVHSYIILLICSLIICNFIILYFFNLYFVLIIYYSSKFIIKFFVCF